MTAAMTYDILVIGGGINGAGVARDAAGRGLKVALCEQQDFAGATSSASTKLIHGGLRYLEYYEFRLVSEALREREHLLDIAPHIAWPMRFVMPHVKTLRPRWMIRLGLWLYDHIGGRISLPHSESIALDKMDNPSGLRADLKQGFAYSDAWVDDARMVVLNLLSAQEQGAHIFARTRLCAAARRGGMWECTLENTADGTRQIVQTRTIVNTAGPWVAAMDSLLNPETGAGEKPSRRSAVKLVRGSHLVVRRQFEGEHAYILQNDDKRIVFLIPYENDYTLIGTTDEPQESMTGGAQVSAKEEAYMLRAANAYLATPVTAADIVWRYAGVRPLFDDDSDDPSAVTRDYTLVLNDADNLPCVSVYGGKITTYRRLAESVLEKLSPWLTASRGSWTSKESLPGGQFKRADRPHEIKRLQADYPRLGTRFLVGLFNRHGLRSRDLLGNARVLEDLGHDFGGGLTQREAEFLIAHEWARAPDDVLWRRTKCGLHMTVPQREAFAKWFETRLSRDEGLAEMTQQMQTP